MGRQRRHHLRDGLPHRTAQLVEVHEAVQQGSLAAQVHRHTGGRQRLGVALPSSRSGRIPPSAPAPAAIPSGRGRAAVRPADRRRPGPTPRDRRSRTNRDRAGSARSPRRTAPEIGWGRRGPSTGRSAAVTPAAAPLPGPHRGRAGRPSRPARRRRCPRRPRCASGRRPAGPRSRRPNGRPHSSRRQRPGRGVRAPADNPRTAPDLGVAADQPAQRVIGVQTAQHVAAAVEEHQQRRVGGGGRPIVPGADPGAAVGSGDREGFHLNLGRRSPMATHRSVNACRLVATSCSSRTRPVTPFSRSAATSSCSVGSRVLPSITTAPPPPASAADRPGSGVALSG